MNHVESRHVLRGCRKLRVKSRDDLCDSQREMNVSDGFCSFSSLMLYSELEGLLVQLRP
jgi:hypothetical protein